MGGCMAKNRYEAGEEVVRKIAILGNSGVGKTCLINSYINDGEFDEDTPHEFIPTALKMDEKRQATGKGTDVTLHIYDIGGEETFKHLRKLNYPKSDAAVICFSLKDDFYNERRAEESLKAVETNWVPEMRRICPGIPLLLVGLRRDLRDEGDSLEGCIRESTGHKVAKKNKMVGYLECSARRNEGIDDVFRKIALEASKKKNKKKADVSG